MTQIYRHFNDKKMIFWNPYVAFWIFEPKETATGKHNFKVGMSVGRQLARDRIKKLDWGNADEVSLIAKLEKEIGEKVEQPTFFDKFRNFLIGSWHRAGRWLGIEVKTAENEFEIFQFVKFDDEEDIIPILEGIGMILGVITKHNESNGRKVIDKATRKLKAGFDKTGRYF